MRRFKKIIVAVILGFLAFAPPGTLIAIFLFLAWLFGDARIVAGGLVVFAIIGISGFIWRRRNTKRKQEEEEEEKL
jgi:nitrate reductase gamma subunit